MSASDIVHAVEAVLLAAAQTKDHSQRGYMTAYQVFDKLDEQLRTALIADREVAGGAGSGVPYGAFSLVATALEMLKPRIEVDYLDTSCLQIRVRGIEDPIDPGYRVCGIYRWPLERSNG